MEIHPFFFQIPIYKISISPLANVTNKGYLHGQFLLSLFTLFYSFFPIFYVFILYLYGSDALYAEHSALGSQPCTRPETFGLNPHFAACNLGVC